LDSIDFNYLKTSPNRLSDGTYANGGGNSGMENIPNRNPDPNVDMTAQMILNADCIAKIAAELGESTTAARFVQERELIRSAANRHLWNENLGMYTDSWQGVLSNVNYLGCFWHLLSQTTTDQVRLNRQVAHLTNPAEYWRYHVFPSLAANQPGYNSPGQYWNGSVWPPTNYMAIKGLEINGYEDIAHQATMNTVGRVYTMFRRTWTIWENYAPDSDAQGGMSGRDFVGWSGIWPISLVIENVLGFRCNAPQDALRWRIVLTGRHGIRNLRFGDNVTSLVCEQRSSSQAPANITVYSSSEYDLTVRLNNADYLFRIIPGTQTITAGGGDVAPRILTQPSDVAVYVGAVATFSVVAAGVPAPGYQWQTSTGTTWYSISGATGAVYRTAPVSMADNGRRFRVVVSNSSGSVTSDAATLTVLQAPPNQPPVVSLTSPVNNSTYTAPASIQLTATATDPDGSIVHVRFYRGTTLLTTDSASPYEYTWANVSSGTYQLRAVATDNQGATSTSTVVNITVHSTGTPGNQPPSITLTSPVNDSTYTAPATIQLTATATDPDGSIANVRFYRGSTLLNTDSASPYEYTWINVSSGTHQLRAVATDNQGATSTSTIITVTVLSSSTPAVWYTLTATANPANGGTISPASGTYLAGSQIQVTATPNANYTFATWSGDATGANPTITITMDADKTLTANFTYTPR
jgi:uncharacterized repeat protein (TIGR02543 family)